MCVHYLGLAQRFFPAGASQLWKTLLRETRLFEELTVNGVVITNTHLFFNLALHYYY